MHLSKLGPVLVLVVAACGGGGSSSTFVAPPVQPTDADLVLAVTVDDGTAVRHQPIEIALSVENVLGGLDTTGVSISVVLPAGLSHLEHTAGAGTYDPVAGIWDVQQVAAGELLELRITATVATGLGTQVLVVDAAIVSVDQPDPEPANDAAAVAVSVDVDAVEIVRDVRGVPHVYAASDQGAYFGAGYATAEARLSQILWKRLVITGTVARHFGRGANDELLESDRKARLYGWARKAAETFALLEPEIASLYTAYAEGVNAFMTSGNAALHSVFAAAGVPLDPWTPADSIAVWNELARNFTQSELREGRELHDFEDLVLQLGGDVDAALAQSVGAGIFDEDAAVVQQTDVPASVQQAMQDYADSRGMDAPSALSVPDTPHFSNAWAIAGTATADGRTLLVADPRVGIARPNTLLEIHISGETFDVRGAGPPGSLGLLIGATPSTAWGITSIALDQADLFRITTDPIGNPGEYRLDGAFRPFLVEELEVIGVLGEQPVRESYRETVFGPLVTPFVIDADPGEEYAVRLVPFFEPGRDSAEGFLAMYRAGDVDELSAALEGFRFPAVNVVFGDSSGRIGYRANGAVPARSTASPMSALAGAVALEGDDSANDWEEIVPHELMPSVVDPAGDVVLSANHAPVGSWYPIHLGGRAQNSRGETSRSRRLRELLEAGQVFDGPSQDAIRTDAVIPGARDIARLALHARDDLGEVFSAAAENALVELEPWLASGAELRAIHRGVVIAAEINDNFRPPAADDLMPVYGGGSAGAQLFLKTRATELDQLGTAALTPEEIDWLDQALANARQGALATYGAHPPTWLTGYAAGALTLESVSWTDTNGFEPLDPGDVFFVGPLSAVGGGVLFAQPAQSYTLRLSIGAVDGALSLLPFGQGEPGAMHAADQVGVFLTEGLLAAPTTKSAVLALGLATTATRSY